jgi:hypothetical protein
VKTVFLVTSGAYSDYHVSCAFSTKELAEAYIEECSLSGDSDPGAVEEFPVDEEAVSKCVPYWQVEITLESGALVRKRCGKMVVNPSLRVWDFGTKVSNYRFPNQVPTAEACSFVSEEHALKVAAELRQEFLRSGEPIAQQR